jgi:predicted RecB family nuclease
VWRNRCSAELIARDDPTLLQNVGPDTRTLLAGHGITTIAGVATLDPDTDLVSDSSIVLQARAKVAGSLLRRDRGTTPIAVHRPTRQIDFDIETYRGRIYLAGFLETVAGETTFDPIVDWSESPDGERLLVKAMFERLASYADSDTKVFYWTSYEPTQLTRAAATHGLSIPGYESVGDWFTAHGVDLHRWTKDRFVSPDGYSLKVIAPLCGFAWRDDDPGGQQSEIWYEDMVAGEVDLRERLLAYNEDDVAAQLAIRRWIDAEDSGGGPGTAIRSVLDRPV